MFMNVLVYCGSLGSLGSFWKFLEVHSWKFKLVCNSILDFSKELKASD